MAKKTKKLPIGTPISAPEPPPKPATNRLREYETIFGERMNQIKTMVYDLVAIDKSKNEPSDPFTICMEVADAFGLHDPVDRGLPDWLTYIVEGEIHNTNPDKQLADHLYRELTIAGDLLRRTPIVDDDFPQMAHTFDALIAVAKKELGIK